VHGRQGCPERLSGQINSGTTEKQWGIWLRADDPRRRGPIKSGAAARNDTGMEQQANNGDRSSKKSLEKERFSSIGNPKGGNQFWAEKTEGKGDTGKISGENLMRLLGMRDSVQPASGEYLADFLGKRCSAQSQVSRRVAHGEASNVHGKFATNGKLKASSEIDTNSATLG
jgi:hypothetical protein